VLEVQLESIQQILNHKEKYVIHIQHEFEMKIQDMEDEKAIAAQKVFLDMDELTDHFNVINEALQQDQVKTFDTLSETIQKHEESLRKYETLRQNNDEYLLKIGSLEKELAGSIVISKEHSLEAKELSLQALVSTERITDLTLELKNYREQLKVCQSNFVRIWVIPDTGVRM
jgi:hypothetical protein